MECLEKGHDIDKVVESVVEELNFGTNMSSKGYYSVKRGCETTNCGLCRGSRLWDSH